MHTRNRVKDFLLLFSIFTFLFLTQSPRYAQFIVQSSSISMSDFWELKTIENFNCDFMLKRIVWFLNFNLQINFLNFNLEIKILNLFKSLKFNYQTFINQANFNLFLPDVKKNLKKVHKCNKSIFSLLFFSPHTIIVQTHTIDTVIHVQRA